MGISGPNNRNEPKEIFAVCVCAHQKNGFSYVFSTVPLCIKSNSICDLCVLYTFYRQYNTHRCMLVVSLTIPITKSPPPSLSLALCMPLDWNVLILMLLLLRLQLLLMNYYCVSNRWTGRHIPLYTDMYGHGPWLFTGAYFSGAPTSTHLQRNVHLNS